MIYAIKGATALTLMASLAQAGGVERSKQSVGILFEQGSLVELSFGAVDASVSGVGVAVTPGASSGDMTDTYYQTGLAYKRDLNESLAFAVIFDQPFGADVSYPTGSGYFAGGATAELDSKAITALLKYKTANNISVFGGLRYQTLMAQASVPFVAGYTGTSSEDGGFGYVVGAAYEKPEIALRVALTYNSAIDHNWSVVETGPVPGTTPLTVSTPQSVNLDVQSGIAKDTLLFGSVRWVNWSDFAISPTGYMAATGASLVAFREDTVTYTLGVGRKFNENWSGAVSLMYEPQVGGHASNLGPKDGATGVTVGLTYKKDKMEITGGLSLVEVGDATTTLTTIAPVTAGNFTGNTAVGAGLRIRYRF
ncbi:outer membrane protein transport protein [Cognatishimia sp. WU-CL00825]|uniref:OmpP1/FadL family transporter n=1 Tax=Cognatishimia sp. WU-CL00825 TaxID=3127658 RepID=UPI0031075FC5